MQDEKTVFAVRLEKDKAHFFKQVLQLVLILASFAAILAVLAAVQIAYCRADTPDATMFQCLSPAKGKSK